MLASTDRSSFDFLQLMARAILNYTTVAPQAVENPINESGVLKTEKYS
ncbi:hypothetical protein [Gimesia panareensis]|nr:hypothetical protein [Gimesia panareensis]